LKKFGFIPTFIEKIKSYHAFNIIMSALTENKKIDIEYGYHYSDRKNIENIMENGLIPINSLNSKSLVGSPWDDNILINGLYEDPRVYFFTRIDDADAALMFSNSNLVRFKIDLRKIPTYVDNLMIGDEDDIVESIWTNSKINTNNIKYEG